MHRRGIPAAVTKTRPNIRDRSNPQESVMSMNSNDPFDNPNAVQGPAVNQGGGQQTYGQDDFAQPPPKKGGKGLLIGCGIVGLLGVLVCCGGVAMVGVWGPGIAGDAVRPEVENSATVIEHIGEIESMSLNFSATVEEAQSVEPGQQGLMVFDVQGTKGGGKIVAQQSPTSQGIDSAVLVLPSGERLPIELASGSAEELDDIEVELNDLIETGSTEE
jgi:hypothetical protein